MRTATGPAGTAGTAPHAGVGTGASVSMADKIAPAPSLSAEATEAPAAAMAMTTREDGCGEERPGDMATSKPRLFLWQRAADGLLPRRGVTFCDGTAATDEDNGDGGGERIRATSIAGVGGHEEAKRSGGGGGGGGGRGRGCLGGGGKVVSMHAARGEEGGVVGVGEEIGPGSGRAVSSRSDCIQLSYAMRRSPAGGEAGGGCSGREGRGGGCGMPRETHRVKLVVGALEFALEQATILAVLRVASSAVEQQQQVQVPVLTPRSPPARASSSGAVSSSPPLLPAVQHAARHEDPGAETTGVLSNAPTEMRGGGEGEGGGVLTMPMLPYGVSATLVVDMTAISVALTEAGVNVAAVAVCAAHCKVNVSFVCVFCCVFFVFYFYSVALTYHSRSLCLDGGFELFCRTVALWPIMLSSRVGCECKRLARCFSSLPPGEGVPAIMHPVKTSIT